MTQTGNLFVVIKKAFAKLGDGCPSVRQDSAFLRRIIGAGFLWGVAIAFEWKTDAAEEPVFSAEQIELFEKHVRPVLASQCWNCHGEKKAESGLRLDSREAVLQGGDRGNAVRLRDGSGSLLVHVVRHEGDIQMPPNGRLSPQQIAMLIQWIDLGLPWTQERSGSAVEQAWKAHWSFQPVRAPAIPTSDHDAWSRTPVDRFVLEQQMRHLSQSLPRRANRESLRAPMAKRHTQIRRATFDLLGIPPTPEEVAAFEGDPTPDAFDRLIDRLLASPKYGERWGRHWLDVARYADTKGPIPFEETAYPWAYTYRDYVIKSLNEDKPYEQFVMEQLAADLLKKDSLNALDEIDPRLAAMGFLTVGSRFMGNVHDIVDDRIDVVTRGLLGLTVTCARCHDHKYDPIPTADYYSLYGVFRSTSEPLVLPLISAPRDTPADRRFSIELSLRQQGVDDFVQQKLSALVEGARTRVGDYLLAAKTANEKPPTDDFMVIADPGDINPAMIVRWQAYLNALAGRERRPRHEDVEQTAATHPVWGIWLELSTVPEDRFAAEAAACMQRAVSQSASNEPLSTTRFNALLVTALSQPSWPQTLIDVAQRYGDLLKSIHETWQSKIQESLILKRQTPERLEDADAEELRLELYGESSPATVPPMFAGWGFVSLFPDRAAQGEFKKHLAEVEQWLINGPGAPPRAMVLQDSVLFDPSIFIRGNPNRLGVAIPRQFLSVLTGDTRKPFTSGSGRLELAHAIVDSANPLTSRFMVNRVWQNHFGTGLVRTPGDFGLRGEPPTHPELLDWLSQEFVGKRISTVDRDVSAGVDAGPEHLGDRGLSLPAGTPTNTTLSNRWSLKRLHRILMTTSVYQQSSEPNAPFDDDVENYWLSHFNRQRLDFEETRDALLFVTDRLDDRIGGPPIPILDGTVHFRRTVYAFLDRANPPSLLSVFDFPSSAATSSSRETTTISPQALFLMNGSLTETVGELVSQRFDLNSESEKLSRVRRLYRILFARSPSGEELRFSEEFLGHQPSPAEWKHFIHGLLLTNEFVFLD